MKLVVNRFHRVWTVQEFVLAQDVVFQFGSTELPVETMVSIVKRYLDEANRAKGSSTPVKFNFMTSVLVYDLFRCREQVQNARVIHARPLTLSQCFLDLALPRRCKDPRDRIYGMLGLASELAIVPDYTLSVEGVYLDFIFRTVSLGDCLILAKYYYNGTLLDPHPDDAYLSTFDLSSFSEVFQICASNRLP